MKNSDLVEEFKQHIQSSCPSSRVIDGQMAKFLYVLLTFLDVFPSQITLSELSELNVSYGSRNTTILYHPAVFVLTFLSENMDFLV